MNEHKGRIVRITGPVLDATTIIYRRYIPPCTPPIPIPMQRYGWRWRCTLGDDTVRYIALNATEGLYCGMDVIDTRAPITVPVGDSVMGRVINVLGDPIDGKARFPRGRAYAHTPPSAVALPNSTPPLKYSKPA